MLKVIVEFSNVLAGIRAEQWKQFAGAYFYSRVAKRRCMSKNRTHHEASDRTTPF